MEITYSYKLCACFLQGNFHFHFHLLFLFRIGLQHYGEMVTLRMHAMPKRPPSVPTQLQKFDEYPQVNCTYSDGAHANTVGCICIALLKFLKMGIILLVQFRKIAEFCHTSETVCTKF